MQLSIYKTMEKGESINIISVNVQTVRAIQYVLRRQLLPIKGTNLSFHIGENLSCIDKFIESIDKQIEELNNKFLFKDENENPKLYSTFMAGKNVCFHVNEKGEFVETTESNPNSARRIDLRNPEYIEALRQINNKTFSEFYNIPKDIIMKLSDAGVLDGVDLSVLLRTVIIK